MKNTVQTPKYSFGLRRYSSSKQSGNSSLDRQDIAPQVSKEKGWTLREDWNITQEAVSAYKKHNFPALRALIRDAEKGIIPQGTVCIVQTLDRLTRASLDEAYDLFRDILRSGIEIYVAQSSSHFTKESLNNPMQLMLAIVEMHGANQYVVKMIENVKAAYTKRFNRMLNGEVVTKTQEGNSRKDCPVWISCDGKEFQLNEKAKIVHAIFADYLNNVGPTAIAHKLNANNVKSFTAFKRAAKGVNKPTKWSDKWSLSVVYRLLADRRVLGEVTVKGETIPGYYPAAITEKIFLKVQAKLAENAGKCAVNDKRGKMTNLFKGVGFCPCGERLKVSQGNKGTYCTCYAKVDGKTVCNQPMIKYSTFENAAMSILRLNPSQLLTDENGEGMNAQLQILRGRKIEFEKQIATATEAVQDAIKNNRLSVLAVIDNTMAGLKKQVADIDSQIALESAKTVANKGNLERLMDILESLQNIATDQAVRIKVNAWFRENVNRITFDRAKKEFTVDLKNGNLIEMDLSGAILGTKSLTAMFGLSKLELISDAPKNTKWTLADNAGEIIARQAHGIFPIGKTA